MGILIRALVLVAALAAAGCYSPSIESCALPCADETDCPEGFDCKDKVCVSGATECPRLPDAAPRPDAAGTPAMIRVELTGRASVVVTPGPEVCSWPETSCTYQFGVGDVVTFEARDIRPNRPFQAWGGACAGTTGRICTVTLSEPVTVVTATFKI